MIGRAFYSTTASTDDIFLWIFCQSTSDIHCYRDVKSIPWNITKSVSRAGFSNLPTPPLMCGQSILTHHRGSVLLKNVFTFINQWRLVHFSPGGIYQNVSKLIHKLQTYVILQRRASSKAHSPWLLLLSIILVPVLVNLLIMLTDPYPVALIGQQCLLS